MNRVVLLAILGVAASAGAAVAKDGMLYGGGKPGSLSGRADQLVALDWASSGRGATLYMSLLAPDCGETVTFATQVKTRADASFAKSGEYSEDFDNHRGTFSAAGRFRGGRAAGTLRVRFRASKGGPEFECDTGKIRWQAVAPTAQGTTGGFKPGAPYGGYTSQRSTFADLNLPLVLKVTRDGARVERLAARLNNYCEDQSFGAQASGMFFSAGAAIRDRAFKGESRFREDHGQTWFDFRSVYTGRFRRSMVTGTWTMSVVIRRKSDGQLVTRCGGEKLRWQAAR